MKINGMEISKVDSTILAKQQGCWRLIRILYFIICIAVCVTFVYCGDLPALYVIPIGLIVTTFFMWLFSRPIKQLNRELSSRQRSEEEILDNRKTEKKAFKTVAIVIAIILIALAAGLNGGSNNSGGSGDKCRNCGRTTDIVPGFGYCEDCYDGFVDWQDDNWKDD